MQLGNYQCFFQNFWGARCFFWGSALRVVVCGSSPVAGEKRQALTFASNCCSECWPGHVQLVCICATVCFARHMSVLYAFGSNLYSSNVVAYSGVENGKRRNIDTGTS